jgi:beta-glucosidase
VRELDPEADAGITLNLMPIYPETDRRRDRAAAEMADQFLNRLFLDPLFKGVYPEELWNRLTLFRPRVTAEEMDTIGEPIDFLGTNTYTREWARFSLRNVPLFFDMTGMKDVPGGDYIKEGVQYTSRGWEVYPEALHQVLLRIKNEYGNIPLYVTENGAAFEDSPVEESDGWRVHDRKRVDYLKKHLATVAQARSEGADVRGYFVWSLLDNFEWAEGYDKRFGIVYVDYESQQRILKDSAFWYRDLISARMLEA